MSIQSILPIGAVDGGINTVASMGTQPVQRSSFEAWLVDQVQATDTNIRAADQAVRELAVGQASNLHDVMLDIQRARSSLELLTQVRNRLVEAYQDIVRMQI